MLVTAVQAEDYPTKQDLVRAGLVAVTTGLVGFVVSYHTFVRPIAKGIHLPGLDRRAAERPLPAAYREQDAGPHSIYFSYGMGGDPTQRRVTTDPKFQLAEPTRTRPLATAPVAQTVQPSATPTALPLPETAYHTNTSPARRFQLRDPRNEQQQAAAGPPRPDPVSYSEAWRRVQSGWVTFGDADRVGGQGIVVADGLVLTTISTVNFTGGRGYVGGQYFGGKLVSSDTVNDLALLEVPLAANPVPICPEGSGPGDLLITGDVLSPGRFDEVRSRGPAASFLGFYGWNSAQAGGAPLINNRGELVGLSLPRTGWDSISWNLAVPASAIQAFIAARPRAGGLAPPTWDLWAKALRMRVTPLNDRVAPSRANNKIVAGQAIGNYPLGMSYEHLKKELGAGQVLEQKGSFMRVLYSGPRLTFTIADGIVVGVETDYNFYVTEAAWSVGNRLDEAQLRARLPEAIVHDHVRSKAACSSGLELLLQGDVVSAIRVTPP